MSLEERERGLLRLVAEQRDDACRRILAEAEQTAGEILRQTHRKERAHLHRRVLEERARIQARIQAVEAERVTRERRQQARSSAGILEQAWPLLQLGLQRRWQDTEGRRRWVGRCVRQALGSLPAPPAEADALRKSESAHAAKVPSAGEGALSAACQSRRATACGERPDLRARPALYQVRRRLEVVDASVCVGCRRFARSRAQIRQRARARPFACCTKLAKLDKLLR